MRAIKLVIAAGTAAHRLASRGASGPRPLAPGLTLDRAARRAACPAAGPSVLRTSGLGKRYPAGAWPAHRGAPVRALEALDIDVRQGEIFGFLGPNGAGKSTTIRILLGFLHPTSGSASVLGHDIVSDGISIRRKVGYLPGGISLYDSMTGTALLDYLAGLYGRPGAAPGIAHRAAGAVRDGPQAPGA